MSVQNLSQSEREDILDVFEAVVRRAIQKRPYSEADRLQKPITPVELLQAMWEIRRNV